MRLPDNRLPVLMLVMTVLLVLTAGGGGWHG